MLVTEPAAAPLASIGDHAIVAWLAKRYAITTLPAVISLRALLVSHWAVCADATVALTTRMFEETTKGAPKAEALRRSMLALIQDKRQTYFAHPAFRAPFVVVGEGNARWEK
jgi:CHAT domain-containing protein